MDFGDLRALLQHGQPRRATWSRLCMMLDAWPEPDELEHEVIPYVRRQLESWPQTLCQAPIRWMPKILRGQRDPRLRLLRYLDISQMEKALGDEEHGEVFDRALAHPDLVDVRCLHDPFASLSLVTQRALTQAHFWGLRELTLTLPHTSQMLREIVAHFKHLHALNLIAYTLRGSHDPIERYIDALADSAHLESLSLELPYSQDCARALVALQSSPLAGSLRSLRLRCDDAPQLLPSVVADLPKLERLSCAALDTASTLELLDALGDLGTVHTLRLDLEGCDGPDAIPRVVEALHARRGSALRELEIVHAYAAGAARLGDDIAARAWPELVALSLLESGGLQTLAWAAGLDAPKLTRFACSYMDIDTLEPVAAAAWCAQLEALSVTHTQLRGCHQGILSRARSVRSLDLRDNALDTQACLALLDALDRGHMPELHELRLEANPVEEAQVLPRLLRSRFADSTLLDHVGTSSPDDLEALAQGPAVGELYTLRLDCLGQEQAMADALRAVLAHPHCVGLTTLYLDHATAEIAQALASSPYLSGLRLLESYDAAGDLLPALSQAHLPALESLSLRGMPDASARSLEAAAQAGWAGQLRTLVLQGQACDRLPIAGLVRASPKLETLIWRGVALEEGALAYAARVAPLRTVLIEHSALDLGELAAAADTLERLEVSDLEGAQDLGPWAGRTFSRLDSLSLCGSPLTGASVASLARGHYPELAELHLSEAALQADDVAHVMLLVGSSPRLLGLGLLSNPALGERGLRLVCDDPRISHVGYLALEGSAPPETIEAIASTSRHLHDNARARLVS